jgi:polyhydroxybutyrate depolymerase
MRSRSRRTVGAVRSLLAALGLVVVLLPLSGATAGASAPAPVPSRPSAGCSLTHPAAPGTANLLLEAGGDQGSYERQIPPTYTGRKPLPVVLDLHGYSEPATLQETLTQLGTYGDSHGFITVTPQVTYTVPMWDTTLGSKDLAFIGGLLATVDSTLCADRNRIFVTGYSDGAFMTSSIACQFAGQVAAVAPVAGIEDPSGCHPTRRVPVVAFHGTADPFVSYTGGLGPASLKLPAPDGSGQTIGQELGGKAPPKTPSIPANTATWAKRNGCTARPHDTRIASDVTLISYACPSNDNVELYRIAGGGHAWPGSVFSKSIESVIGRVTFSISADQIIWKFFQAHPRRG